jgi:hypothetical protein
MASDAGQYRGHLNMSASDGSHARQSVGDPADTPHSGERGYRKTQTGGGLFAVSSQSLAVVNVKKGGRLIEFNFLRPKHKPNGEISHRKN